MLLFLPFRSINDIKLNESYLKQWQYSLQNGMFPEKMIVVAENIQHIHNSMEATLTENPLNSRTILEEADDIIENLNEDNTARANEDLLNNVAELFASEKEILTEETRIINQSFSGKFFKPELITEMMELKPLQSVLSYENSHQMDIATENNEITSFPQVFQTAVSELNTLAITQFIVINEEQNESNQSEIENESINATGTCQSICEWGKRANLDKQQQCAFEILSATYVLTFYEQAKNDVIDEMSTESFELRKEQLSILARRDPTSDKPLQMFITGPPGAGKCKFAHACLSV